MSIHFRLVLAIGLLLLATMAATIAAVLIDAAPRIKAENESSMQLTREIIQSSLVALEDAANPRRALDRLVAHLGTLRHVRVSLASRLAGEPITDAKGSVTWPGIFAHETLPPEEIPVRARGSLLDVIVIAPKASDEIDEVWAAAGHILQYGVLMTLALVPLTGLLISRSLQPIDALAKAMRVMEDGNYDVRVDESGPPEIAAICARLNTLAEALRASRAEITTLSARLLEVQDAERREIAHELHDELGPHLFSIRARSAFLGRALVKDSPDLERAQAETAEIASEIEALQQTNRRVLNRLSPPGLRELGLAGALQGLAREWREIEPAVDLHVVLPPKLDTQTESTRLTIYRICQEGLTNAYRHAQASRITLSIDETIQEGSRALRVEIEDDGVGPADVVSAGHGITGMRERVAAHGGTLRMTRGPLGGTQLQAVVPTV